MKNTDYKIILNNEKMAMPFFSVIMLTYNAEEIVEKALKNIYNQTFSDFEIVLINDCSNDDTDEVIKINKEQRLKYIKNDINKGVGKSRELGVSIAKGQYLVFVDVDDVVDSDLLLNLKKEIDKNNPDLIIYGFEEKYINENNKILWNKKRSPIEAYKEYKINITNDNQYDIINNVINELFIKDNNEIKNLMIYLEDSTILGYPWNKCYKKQIIENNNIHFEDINIYEDIFFNIEYYKKINNLSLLDKVFYTYNNQNNKSITKKDYKNYFELSKERVKRVKDTIKENNKLNIKALNILKRIYIRYAYSELNRCINRKWTIKKIKERFVEIRNDELFENILNEIKAYGDDNKKEQNKFSKIMENCFIINKKICVILMVQIINFINKYMYWLYLKIAK